MALRSRISRLNAGTSSISAPARSSAGRGHEQVPHRGCPRCSPRAGCRGGARRTSTTPAPGGSPPARWRRSPGDRGRPRGCGSPARRGRPRGSPPWWSCPRRPSGWRWRSPSAAAGRSARTEPAPPGRRASGRSGSPRWRPSPTAPRRRARWAPSPAMPRHPGHPRARRSAVRCRSRAAPRGPGSTARSRRRSGQEPGSACGPAQRRAPTSSGPAHRAALDRSVPRHPISWSGGWFGPTRRLLRAARCPTYDPPSWPRRRRRSRTLDTVPPDGPLLPTPMGRSLVPRGTSRRRSLRPRQRRDTAPGSVRHRAVDGSSRAGARERPAHRGVAVISGSVRRPRSPPTHVPPRTRARRARSGPGGLAPAVDAADTRAGAGVDPPGGPTGRAPQRTGRQGTGQQGRGLR